MKLNWKIVCAFALIIAQLGVVGYSINKNAVIAKTGTEYKFKIEPVDPYDIFRGRYVRFNIADGSWPNSDEVRYATIEVAEDGFSKISGYVTDKPVADYISLGKYGAIPVNRYYLDEIYAQAAEDYVRRVQWDDRLENVYVVVRVKDGNPVVTGMFVDGVKIEDVLASQ